MNAENGARFQSIACKKKSKYKPKTPPTARSVISIRVEKNKKSCLKIQSVEIKGIHFRLVGSKIFFPKRNVKKYGNASGRWNKKCRKNLRKNSLMKKKTTWNDSASFPFNKTRPPRWRQTKQNKTRSTCGYVPKLGKQNPKRGWFLFLSPLSSRRVVSEVKPTKKKEEKKRKTANDAAILARPPAPFFTSARYRFSLRYTHRFTHSFPFFYSLFCFPRNHSLKSVWSMAATRFHVGFTVVFHWLLMHHRFVSVFLNWFSFVARGCLPSFRMRMKSISSAQRFTRISWN